ncbi:hypothetical protein BR93DRAFT_815129 [Coniochaeta sp. PMI_546]|nr:hypothetical protein BR93DRAFT_815129 [Coniochaeta sp. PMI_546]
MPLSFFHISEGSSPRANPGWQSLGVHLLCPRCQPTFGISASSLPSLHRMVLAHAMRQCEPVHESKFVTMVESELILSSPTTRPTPTTGDASTSRVPLSPPKIRVYTMSFTVTTGPMRISPAITRCPRARGGTGGLSKYPRWNGRIQ